MARLKRVAPIGYKDVCGPIILLVQDSSMRLKV